MLDRVNSFAPYLAIAIIGYLTYSESMGPSDTFAAVEGKELPSISAEMLNPTLLTPVERASGVGRDPFEVTWASYLEEARLAEAARLAAERVAEAESRATTRPAEEEMTDPAMPSITDRVPSLPSRLTGIIWSDETPLAILDDEIYTAGSLIGGTNPRACWTIVKIERTRVTVSFGPKMEVIELPRDRRIGPDASVSPSELPE